MLALAPTFAAAQTVRGRVLDGIDRQPLAGAMVEFRDSSGTVLRQMLTSPSGKFAFVVPSPGAYQVRFASVGYLAQPGMQINVPAEGFVTEDIVLFRARGNSGFRAVAVRVVPDQVQRLPPIVAAGKLTFEKIAQLHRMWDQVTGAPIAVVVYDIKFTELVMHGRGESRTAHIDLRLRQENTPEHRSRDTTARVDLLLPESQGFHPEFKGFFVAGSMDGITAWTLIPTQPEHLAGADWENNRPPLTSGPLALSDIVIGAGSQDLTWARQGVGVLLAPLDEINRHDQVRAYYQVRSATERPAVHTTILLFHDEEMPSQARAVMTIERDDSLKQGVNDIELGLDPLPLPPGRYRVLVTVTDATGKATATQTALVHFKE